jgi:hypothetical protein
VVSWSQFVTAAPLLARRVRALFEQEDQPLGYLATVRSDGGPRVHPVVPIITGDGLFCFLMRSPKRRDLERDGRYALHALPGVFDHDEAYLAGAAAPVTDEHRVEWLARRWRAAPEGDWRVFELQIQVAMVGRAGPGHQVWHAPDHTCAATAGRVE